MRLVGESSWNELCTARDTPGEPQSNIFPAIARLTSLRRRPFLYYISQEKPFSTTLLYVYTTLYNLIQFFFIWTHIFLTIKTYFFSPCFFFCILSAGRSLRRFLFHLHFILMGLALGVSICRRAAAASTPNTSQDIFLFLWCNKIIE